MFELVFSVCLIANAQSCKDVRLTYGAESVTLMECALIGQVEMAKWMAEHPGYRVTRYRCDTPRRAGIDA